MPIKLCLFTVLLPIFLFVGCSESEKSHEEPGFSASNPSQKTTYIFSIHPLHNPTRLHAIFSPIMDYLSQQIAGTKFVLEASRNYESYDERLYAGKPHFSLPNPFETINSLKHGYKVFGKMADDHNFRGIILVRKDSGIETVRDLKGKTISYPAPTALAATMMPQYYLYKHGLDVVNEVTSSYVGSQESSIMNVFLKDSAAGATWPPPWRALARERPELQKELEVKWETETLPNNALVARADVPAEVVKRVGELLFSLDSHSEGRVWLERMGLSHFEPASNDTYQPVIDFVKKFSSEVRPLN